MRGNGFRLAFVLLCCAAAATGFAAASLAQSEVEDRAVTSTQQDPPPSRLWEEFPLGQPTSGPAKARSDRVSHAREPVAFEPVDTKVSTYQELQLVLLSLIVALVIVAPVLLGPAVFALVRTRRPVSPGAAAAATPRPRSRRAMAADRERSAYVALQRTRLLDAMRRPGTADERVHAARVVAVEALERDIVSSQNAKERQEHAEEKDR